MDPTIDPYQSGYPFEQFARIEAQIISTTAEWLDPTIDPYQSRCIFKYFARIEAQIVAATAESLPSKKDIATRVTQYI